MLTAKLLLDRVIVKYTYPGQLQIAYHRKIYNWGIHAAAICLNLNSLPCMLMDALACHVFQALCCLDSYPSARVWTCSCNMQGAISRYHDPANYCRALGGVLRARQKPYQGQLDASNVSAEDQIPKVSNISAIRSSRQRRNLNSVKPMLQLLETQYNYEQWRNFCI